MTTRKTTRRRIEQHDDDTPSLDAASPFSPAVFSEQGSSASFATKRDSRRAIVFLLGFVFLAAVSFAGYEFFGLPESNVPPAATAEEIEQLLADVGKLVVLPAGEEPSILTVTDPAKLEGHEFFRAAKTGDKLLIYAEAGRAILYSPAEQKIVDIAPLRLGER